MACADTPKLYYFPTTGRAEVTRLIFTMSGKPFEDIRFSFEEWGSKYKAESPLGTAPFYEEGGVKLAGSLAIARLVAEKHGLGGRNEMENAQLDSYADAIGDIATKLHPLMFGPQDKREDIKKEFLANMPGKFAAVEKNVKGVDSFLIEKISWPDLFMSQLCLEITEFGLEAAFKGCPKIMKLVARVDSDEKIKAFRAKHAK